MAMILFWVCIGLIGVGLGGGVVTDLALRQPYRIRRIILFTAAYFILLAGFLSLIALAISVV